MDIVCRPMEVSDYAVVECQHWTSAGQVREYINRQGIASMLAFDGPLCVGQLYLQQYDPAFTEPGGWTGERPWADFQAAEPLDLDGRLLTLGCYHVGGLPDNSRDGSLWGRGIGTTLLKAVIRWCRDEQSIDGLLSWALVRGCRTLLQAAGQMPHTVYQRHGFQEVKQVQDAQWAGFVAGWNRERRVGTRLV